MVPNEALLRVIPTFNIAGISKMQNRFHLQHVTGSAQSDALVTEACGEWCERFYDDLKEGWSSDVSCEKVEVYIYESGEWNPLGVASATIVGESATDRAPSGVCMLLKMYKARSGYSDKKYIGGWVDANVTGDTFVGGALALGGLALDAWGSAFESTSEIDLQAVAWNPITEETATYVSGEVSGVVSYQRRRRPGTGLT